jgi:hypothetical protein|tara:strand:+ start:384 stop:551 length:168 start_codon:yes stop_codon:yes gene_type:complete
MIVKIIEGFLTTMNKEEYRVWQDWIIKYNHNNPTDEITYEVNWDDDTYKVKLFKG